jgi:dihydropteroate synthase
VSPANERALYLGPRSLRLGRMPLLMGILNVTPDSFVDGGRYSQVADAVRYALQMMEDGAVLIDVGGESTRPGAALVDAREERRRVVPVIEAIVRERPDALVSIDTRKAEVAQAAIDVGALMVNDVSGLSDQAMAPTVARSRVALCVMHMRGQPSTMQQSPTYGDLVAEVKGFLVEAVARAKNQGVETKRMLVDPGIGFGKTLAHNVTLLRELDGFRSLGLPVLLGVSRKSFLGALTGQPLAGERMVQSVALSAVLAAQGRVDCLRVHDVHETAQALKVVEALVGSSREADRGS